MEGWSLGGARSDLTLILADTSVIAIIADPSIFFLPSQVAILVIFRDLAEEQESRD